MIENNKSKERELQKKVIEINILDSQTKEIEENMEKIVKQINEFQQLKLALRKLGDIKKDSEMYSPLGNNIFVKTTLQDNEKVLVNVGKHVFIKKTLPEALETVEKSIEEASEFREKLLKDMETMTNRMIELQGEIEKIQN